MKDFIRYILKENLPKKGILIKEGVEISDGLKYHKEYDLPLVNFGKQIKNSPKQEIDKDFSIMDRQSEAHCLLIPTSKLPLFKDIFKTFFFVCIW